MVRPHREVQGHTPMMYDRGKSHSAIVPEKPPNKPGLSVRCGGGGGKGAGRGKPTRVGHAPDTEPVLRATSTRAVRQEMVRLCNWVVITCRHHLRQEPDAVVPHVRICAGGHRATGVPT